MAKRKTKAKRNGHPKPVESDFGVGFSPVPAETLAPKAAARWLEKEAPLFHELVEESLKVAANQEERDALGVFNFMLGQTVQAASRAVAQSKPALLEVERDGEAVLRLALVLRAALRMGDRDDCEEDELLILRHQLGDIADALVSIGRKQLGERLAQLKAEREIRECAQWDTPEGRAAVQARADFEEAGKSLGVATHAAVLAGAA